MDAAATTADPLRDEVDLERRFGGVRRLYGDAGYQRLRDAHVAVVGLGGVGSWAVEALARSGVAGLTLIDIDHVSEWNINSKLTAMAAKVGEGKTVALRESSARISKRRDGIPQIHPGCDVR